MKLSYLDTVEVAQNEVPMVVRLSAFSIALLTAIAGGKAAETFYWAELTDEQKDDAESALSLAALELMTEVVQEEETMPLGIIVPFAGAVVPEKWKMCYGQILARSDYQELWDVIDSAYKELNFEWILMPDLRSRMPIGYDTPSWPIGYQGGESEHELTLNEMPSHQHTYDFTSSSATTGGIRNSGYVAARPSTGSELTHLVGGGLAHNNMPPFHVVSGYIMKVKP